MADGLAVHGNVGDHRGAHADDKACKAGADGAPGGQLGTVLGLRRDRRSHGTVRDVDGGVEDGTPQNVGDCQPSHLEAVRHGKPTARTGKILAATPMGRFGNSEKDLVGALLFLLNNDAAGFITGICLPVDGGFSAYSGV